MAKRFDGFSAALRISGRGAAGAALAIAAASAAWGHGSGAHGGAHDHAHDGDGLDAHVHGAAQLTVAQDGGAVEIAFASAMWNIVGFEREPRTEAEAASLHTAAAALADPIALFGVPAAARCTTARAAPGLTGAAVTAASAAVPAKSAVDGHHADDAAHDHDHDHDHDHEHDHAHDHGNHDAQADHGTSSDHDARQTAEAAYDVRDLSAEWTLTCAAPDAFAALSPNLFAAFPNLETVEAAFIGERQRAATLTRDRPSFQLK